MVHRLDFYTVPELEYIIRRSAEILNAPTTPEGCLEIAKRCRGTPRVANRLLKRIRDYAQVKGTGEITAPIARDALKLLDIDEHGFDDNDRKLLRAVIEKYRDLPDDAFVWVRQRNEETIHKYDVEAEGWGTLGELRSEILKNASIERHTTREEWLGLTGPAR